jgi:hypothetical protein
VGHVAYRRVGELIKNVCRNIRRENTTWETILKWVLNKKDIHWIYLAQVSVEESCVDGNETSGSIKGEAFLN